MRSNFDSFWPHVMTVQNDRLLKRWNDHLLMRWNDHLLRCKRLALMLIDCLYFWGFSLRLHMLRTIWRWFWLKCWWLMHFFKKTWSNECVWGPINGPSMTLRKSFKWMWCQNAASDVDAIRCTGGWKWCQTCCIRSWNDQMHADGCFDEVVRAASDVDVIRCTDDCFDVRLLHSTSKRSDERQLMLKLLHLIAMKLDARWRLFEEIARTASDVDVIKCTDGCLDVRKTASDLERSDALTRLSVMSNDCTRC